MNTELLLREFERIGEAPDAMVRLRRFVLDLAVSGCLIDQNGSDGPLDVKQLRSEPRSGPARKRQRSQLSTSSAMLSAIPHGWLKATVGDIAECLDYMREPVNAAARNARIAGKALDELFPYFGATQQQGWIDDFIFDEELVLLGEDGVPFLDPLRPKAYIISGKSWVNNHAHVLRAVNVTSQFLALALNAFDYRGRVMGATRSKLNQGQMVTIPVALPPLAEQRRITAKVDELMSLCDQLEQVQKERELQRDALRSVSLYRLTSTDADADLSKNVRFFLDTSPRLITKPEHIAGVRETVLDLAVRGRLVPHYSEDGSGDDLLANIAGSRQREGARKAVPLQGGEKALPSLPDAWTWAAIDEVSSVEANAITDGPFGANLKTAHYIAEPGFRVVRLENIGHGSFRRSLTTYITQEHWERLSKHHVFAGDLVVAGLVDPSVRACEIPADIGPALVKADCYRFHVHPEFATRFALYYLNSPLCQDFASVHHHGMTLTRLGLGNFRHLPIPVPPLAEQQRIVTKVDELLVVCDQLEVALRSAQHERGRLLEALLRDALNESGGTMDSTLMAVGSA